MTSSYLISTRKPHPPTQWSNYMINQGVCPEGFGTVLYGDHGWKMCVPLPKLVERKCDPASRGGWSTNRATLYDAQDMPNGHRNQIPIQTRRQLHSPRAELDRYDYFQLPSRYNGTGYDSLASWKKPQYAEDMVDVPPVWDEYRLQQPYPLQQQSIKSAEEDWRDIMTSSDIGVAGCFYGKCPNKFTSTALKIKT